MIINKSISFFMIFLIVTIPFQVSSVYAYSGSLTNIKVTGKDNIENVLDVTDQLNVSLLAEMYDSDGQRVQLNNNNIKIKYDSYESSFKQCTDTGSAYLCKFNSINKDWASGKHSMEIKLYDNFFILLDSYENDFYIDDTPPEIVSFEPDSTITEDFNVNYHVKDLACSNCYNDCVGLSKLEFIFEGELIDTITNVSGCEVIDGITFSPETLNLEEGSKEFCMIVYDKFNHQTQECKTVYIDYMPPEFGELVVLHDGVPVSFSSNSALDAILSIEIIDYESGISDSDVQADFSSLNIYTPENYLWKNPVCTNFGEIYTCEWNVLIHGIDGEVNIQINATDNAGNINYYTQKLKLDEDAYPPAIVSIDSGFEDDEGIKYLKKEDNKIIVEVQENGAGISKSEIYMDLYSINSGYGNQVKADYCEQYGPWFCYWEDINIVNKAQGSSSLVRVLSAKDDIGNLWTLNSNEAVQEFIYDNKAPEFIEINITPLGSELIILREGDVAKITAKIKEDVSGLKAENVLANFNDIYSELNYTRASSCENINDDIWICQWEYSGLLVGGNNIMLDIVVTDNAGNEKRSEDQNIFGKIFVAGVSNKVVDYWKDDAVVYDVNKLNRNFLWMSSLGTYIYAGLSLDKKTSSPYVHSFKIISCNGGLVIPGEDLFVEEFPAFSIKDQYYFPDIPRTDKNIIINIPYFVNDNTTLSKATDVKIICESEVIQGRTLNSDVYSPNEKVNITIVVPLTNSIFESPDMANVDKINKYKGQIQKLDGWIKSLKVFVDFLQPLCETMHLIRETITGICMIINTLWGTDAQSTQCFLRFKIIDKLWEGEAFGKEGQALKDTVAFGSTKPYFSLGYVCDLVLCHECDNFWKQSLDNFGFDLNEFTRGLKLPITGWDTATVDIPATDKKTLSPVGNYDPRVNFDPQQSMLVAILCNPPCLTGIVNKLQMYKNILTTYNTCLNVAQVRGYDQFGCEDYLTSATCRYIWVGEWWYLIENFMSDYIAKYALFIFEQKIIGFERCPDRCSFNKACQSSCLLFRTMYQYSSWIITYLEAVDSYNNIKNKLNDLTEEDVENEV